MKTSLFTAVLITVSLSSFGQDPKSILKKSYDKCQSIQNGTYEMRCYVKYGSSNDTVEILFNGAFKKKQIDSLYGGAFHYKIFYKGECTGNVLYTGNEFVRINARDSSAIIMSNKLWSRQILSFNTTIYSPFINKESAPLPQAADFNDKSQVFKFIGEETINNLPCYHVQVNKSTVNNNPQSQETLRNEYHYWITKADFVPVQYAIAYDWMADKDVMHDYIKIALNKFKINNFKDEDLLTLSSIPSNYTIKDYVLDKIPDLLAQNTIAPNWELFSVTGKKVSLNDLKGQLVLLDFFYKACAPCILSLPSLRLLHQKYTAKGLKVIGIDTFDKKEDDLKSFLSKHRIAYPVLLDKGDVSNNYHISAYPAIYLIDKNGKIIFSHVGYTKGIEKMLEKIIKQNL